MRHIFRFLSVVLLLWPVDTVCAAEPPGITALLRAYPEELEGFDGANLIWRDGTKMPVGVAHPEETLSEAIHVASIMDMMRLPYPRGELTGPPAVDADPAESATPRFSRKLYGDCRRGAVDPRMVPIVWLPKSWGHTVRATSVNGVARRLELVSREIDDMPAALRRFAYPLGGIYKCRAVADTGEPSLHGMGAAIDLNVALSDYWLWRRGAAYENRIPPEIVAAFERRGFIWGGKWFHYDTMHFEYRPELLGMDGAADE